MEKEYLINKQYAYRESDPSYKGNDLHQNIMYGPLEQRSCKDVFFCLLYLLFWVGLIVIAGIALDKGDPKRLAQPFDPDGNACGHGLAADYPYLFFPSLNSIILTNSQQFVCVSQCPNSSQQGIQCLINTQIPDCQAIYTYPTIQVISVCLPANNSTLGDIVDQYISIPQIEEWLSDLKATWQISLSCGFIALGISIILMLLLRIFAGFITWLMIIGYFIILIVLGILCIDKANGDQSNLPEQLQSKDVLTWIGSIFLVTAGFSFILFLCYFNKIKKSIAILKAASTFTREVFYIALVPIIMFIFIGGFFTFWIIISLYIYSCGTVIQNPQSPFGSIDWDVGVKRTLIYYLFGLFWNCEFVISLSQFIIASTCAMWYFSHRQGGQMHNPIAKSVQRGLIYHVGSIAFGSLILAIVLLIKFIMELLYNQSKKSINQNGVNSVATCCMKCMICCISCFERFIRIINQNAFIMIALTGSSFCTAAHDAFYLILRNIAQFSITQGIGNIFCFFGRLFICATTTVIGYLIITNDKEYSEVIYSPAIPTIMFGIISFVIGSIFMNIYGMSSDTLLICLCVDKELSKGSAKSCPVCLAEFENEHM